MKSMVVEVSKLENLVAQLFDSVDRGKIYRIYSNWPQIEVAMHTESAAKFKDRWFDYLYAFDEDIMQDSEFKRAQKELDEIKGIINYKLLEDYPRHLPEDWRDANTNEIVLNKLKFKREKRVFENWDSISEKLNKGIAIANKIRPSCISKLIHLGLVSIRDQKKREFDHYVMVKQKQEKQEMYRKNETTILEPATANRDGIICNHIEKMIVQISNEAPELFCVDHPKFQHKPQTEEEMILFDYIEVINSLSDRLRNDFFKEKTEEICNNANNV